MNGQDAARTNTYLNAISALSPDDHILGADHWVKFSTRHAIAAACMAVADQEKSGLEAEIQYLRHLCSTILDVLAAVNMDTPEDRALHDEAVSTFRTSLSVSHLARQP